MIRSNLFLTFFLSQRAVKVHLMIMCLSIGWLDSVFVFATVQLRTREMRIRAWVLKRILRLLWRAFHWWCLLAVLWRILRLAFLCIALLLLLFQGWVWIYDTLSFELHCVKQHLVVFEDSYCVGVMKLFCKLSNDCLCFHNFVAFSVFVKLIEQ